MGRFKLIAGLMSLVVLAGLVLIVVVSAPAEAGGKQIKSSFNLVENPGLVFPLLGASGLLADGLGGEIRFNGQNPNQLGFELKMAAKDLESLTWYYLAVTVREAPDGASGTFPGGVKPVAIAVAGMTRTDDAGRLEFKGRGLLPNVFDFPETSGVDHWRIDQQVRRIGDGELNNCVECILVCAPTTKVKLVNGKLVQL